MASETPGRLISHFKDKAVEQQGQGWAELWDNGEEDLWDRGFPAPGLVDLLAEKRDLLSPKAAGGGRKRALVPGCGKGHDAIMLALHGFDTWGLEISSTAVLTAQRYSAEQMKDPSSGNFATSEEIEKFEAGTINFIRGNFFENDWESAVPGEKMFDLIYDYTFLCALLPDMRAAWRRRIAELLPPGGLLICLEFPLWKDLKSPGPPWGLKGVYWDLLARGGDGKTGTEQQECPSLRSHEGQFTRELYIKPAKSFKQGRGEDMLAVWRRK